MTYKLLRHFRQGPLVTTREATSYIISVACLCLLVCQTITFESFDVGSSYLHIRCTFREYGSKFVYESHRVKAIRRSNKGKKNLYSRNVKIPSALTPV